MQNHTLEFVGCAMKVVWSVQEQQNTRVLNVGMLESFTKVTA